MKRIFPFWILLVLSLSACTANPPAAPTSATFTQAAPTLAAPTLPEPTHAVPTEVQPGDNAQLANPASQNCIQQGGTLSIQMRGDGAQYGVCFFDDNRQCEEWTMLRGECPVGGLKVTGYVTPAAVYCAITGGTYTAADQSNTGEEQGTCAFPNGPTCDVWEYYNGQCSAGEPAAPTSVTN